MGCTIANNVHWKRSWAFLYYIPGVKVVGRQCKPVILSELCLHPSPLKWLNRKQMLPTKLYIGSFRWGVFSYKERTVQAMRE